MTWRYVSTPLLLRGLKDAQGGQVVFDFLERGQRALLISCNGGIVVAPCRFGSGAPASRVEDGLSQGWADGPKNAGRLVSRRIRYEPVPAKNFRRTAGPRETLSRPLRGLHIASQRIAQFSPCMEQAAFNRGDRQSRDSGGFIYRQLAKISQLDSLSHVRSQRPHRRGRKFLLFSLEIAAFGTRTGVGNLRHTSRFFAVLQLIDRYFAQSTAFAPQHKRFVNYNAR